MYYRSYLSIFKLIIGVCSVVIVAVQDRIVDNFHCVLVRIVGLISFLCKFSLPNWGRIRSLNFSYKFVHDFLTKSIVRTQCHLIHFLLFLLWDVFQGIHDRLLNWLVVQFMSYLVLTMRCWVNWVSFHLYVFLDLILMILVLFLVNVLRTKLIFEKFAISHRWKFLTQL